MDSRENDNDPTVNDFKPLKLIRNNICQGIMVFSQSQTFQSLTNYIGKSINIYISKLILL
jgi:hypothetical protein